MKTNLITSNTSSILSPITVSASTLVLIVLSLLYSIALYSSVAPLGPEFFVIAEVTAVYSQAVVPQEEEAPLENPQIQNSLNLKICSIETEKSSFIKVGEIYRAIDNYPGTFEVGDRIRAGIARGSTMGPHEVVSWLQWSGITRIDGTPVITKTDRPFHLTSIQSDGRPILVSEEESISRESESRTDTQAADSNKDMSEVPAECLGSSQ